MKLALLLVNLLVLFQSLLCSDEEGNADKCGGTFSGFQYTIVSPNYPMNYPSDRDCIYILKGSQFAKCDQEFHLQFLDFQLEASDGCSKDYVKVGAANTYCGNSIGIRKFKSQDNSLKVIFHSDKNTTAKGFRILVTTLACVDPQLNATATPVVPKENLAVEIQPGLEVGVKTKEDLKSSYPVRRPGVTFDSEDETAVDEDRGDQPPSRLKSPPESLELPEFTLHDFHDEKCDHAVQGVPKITSYLYLPPASLVRPLKITGSTKPNVSKFGVNTSFQEIPNQPAIRNFEDTTKSPQFSVDVVEPPIEFVLPTHRSPLTFDQPEILQQTRKVPRPSRPSQSMVGFQETNNGWLTYGTPNSPTPPNPTTNFDPFAHDYNNNNNNNNNPGITFHPASPNCGGNTNTNFGGGSGNPNFYPAPFYPGTNVNTYYPNNDFGNGNGGDNGYPGTGTNFDTGFSVNNNNNNNNNDNVNPTNFATNGNYYPNSNANNPFYGTDDTTYYNTGTTECCGSSYTSESFVIANPGFPSLIHSSSSYECQYTIQRASSTVCQLSLYLKFFNFGSEDQFCAYGYVEIDGRRLCGCKTGTNITTSFDNIATKTINVKYLGYPKVKFSGFVIEVTQQSCSTNYLRFSGGNQYLLRHSKRSVSDVEDDGVTSKAKRDTSGYFYQRPNSAALSTNQNFFLGTCQAFKFVNWVKAAKQVYLKNAQCSRSTSSTGVSSSISVIPIFPETGNSPIISYPATSNCEVVNVVEGIVSSPYYPNSYSGNLNQCYRFFKAPGYCQLELAILDFDLEDSTICRKDYVSFSGQKRRYCGTSLAGSRTIFDMTRSSFADLYFVTDSSGSGRGFRAGFTQISC